jgi:DNA-binding GntR family transcriptional regulator
LGFTRTTFTPQGQPIEFVRSVYLGNLYKLRISLKPMSSNMQHQGA